MQKKLISTFVSVAMLSGCMDAVSDEQLGGTSEGERPVGQEVSLRSATYDGFSLAAYDGKELFRGIVLADGPVAQAIPTIRDHLAVENSLQDPAVLEQARSLHSRILELVEQDSPQMFANFERSILSGDHVEIVEAINRGRAAARKALPRAQSELSLGTDEKCIVAAVVVAVVAAHVVVAVNHALAHETVWVTGATTADPGDELALDGETQALLVSEAASDIASKVQVPVWEFTSPSEYQGATAYTDNTNHRLFMGDFDGDGQKDDRFYYSPGGTNDELVSVGAGDFTANFTRTAQPKIGDFDGNQVDDILFYEPGSASHFIWFFAKTTGTPSYTFVKYNGSSSNIAASTSTQAVVGDFDNNGRSDIFWYAPGAGAEYIWRFATDRSFSTLQARSVSGTYTALAGDFKGNNADDILWWCKGTCTDSIWDLSSGSQSPTVSGVEVGGSTYRPVVYDFDNNGKDDIFWYEPGEGTDWMWRWNTDGTYGITSWTVNGTYSPAVGKLMAGPIRLFSGGLLVEHHGVRQRYSVVR